MKISTKIIHHSGENSKAQHLNKYDENICEQMMDSIVVVEIQISKHRKGQRKQEFQSIKKLLLTAYSIFVKTQLGNSQFRNDALHRF